MVAVEIIGHGAAGQADAIDPETGGDIGETGEGFLGGEGLRRDQVFRRHLVRILSQGHAGEVQEPQGLQVPVGSGAGVGQHRGELFDRCQGPFRENVDPALPDRQNAAFRGVVLAAVPGFPKAQIGDAEAEFQLVDDLRRSPAHAGQETVGRGQVLDGPAFIAEEQLRYPQVVIGFRPGAGR